MGFKMKGSPAKLGTIQGTAGHRSALKQEEQKVKETSWWKMQEGLIPDELQGGDKAVMVDGKKVGKLKHVESGGKLPEGSELTDKQKKKQEAKKSAEKPTTGKKMKSEDWKKGQETAKSHGDDLDALVSKRKGLKKGSDEYNVVQNKINRALGDKTRHGVTTEATDTKGRKTEEVKTTPGEGTETKKTTGDPDDPKKVVTKTRDDKGRVIKKVKVKGDVTKTTDKTQTDEKGKAIVVKTKSEKGKDDKVKVRRKGGTGLGAKIKGIFKKKNKKGTK